MASKHRGRRGDSGLVRFLKGLGAALAVTLGGIAVFALLMQWVRPADGVVRFINQVLKLVAIGVGVSIAVGRGGQGGLLRGALVGLVYMGIGVGLYALLSGQQSPITAYAADLAMGVAGGGIIGMLLSGMEKGRR